MLEGWNAHRARPCHHGRGYRVRIRCGLNKHRSSCAAVLWIWSAMPIFNAAVDIQHGCIVPSQVVRLRREEIPIVLVAARPRHAIDTGPTTQDLAHRERHGASVEMRVGLGTEAPVTLASQVQEPLVGFLYTGHVIAAAGLDEQDTDLCVF